MIDPNSWSGLPAHVGLTSATAINNHDQIAAIGLIPEPETYAMLLAGLGLIGGVMARRRKAV
ncbi:MAG: PEP-CTERM sorting domain-containing protein [Nitrosospira sp.]